MPILPGNLSAITNDSIIGTTPGWEIWCERGTAWIGPTPARVWDILTDRDIPLVIPAPVASATVTLMLLRFRLPSALIGTVTGDRLLVASTVTVDDSIFAVGGAAGGVSGGVMPPHTGQNPGLSSSTVFNTIAVPGVATTLRLWASTSGFAASGLLSASTSKGVRVGVEAFFGRRTIIADLSDFNLSQNQLKQDQGIT